MNDYILWCFTKTTTKVLHLSEDKGGDQRKKGSFYVGGKGGRGDEGDADKSLNLSGRMLEYKLV